MADKINAAGYETKPWWPYVRELMEGGGSVTVEQLNVTENGTYTAEAGKAYSPVVVNVEGGSSDFSTAKVTVNVTYPEDSYTLVISAHPTVREQVDSLIIENNVLGYEYEISHAETKQLDLLLYKGQGKIAVLGTEISVSGNATLEDNVVTFTGDFTINATAEEP